MLTSAPEGVAWASAGLSFRIHVVGLSLRAFNGYQSTLDLGLELICVYLLKLSATLVKVLDTVFEVEGLCLADLDVGNQRESSLVV